jgi:transcriptional regulator with XRE-family HTH domain
MDKKMITSQQMRAARALLGIDQRELAELAGISLPTIQRMESSDGQVRGVVDTLVKVIGALESSGIELIGENASSVGIGRGVRLRETMDGKAANKVGSILFDQAKPEADAG